MPDYASKLLFHVLSSFLFIQVIMLLHDYPLQGFASIGDVDWKGRAHKMPVRADIRKALCFPGDSTLMVSHLKNDKVLPDRSHAKICFFVPCRIPSTIELATVQNTLNSECVNLLDPQGQHIGNTVTPVAANGGCLTGNEKCNGRMTLFIKSLHFL